MGCGGSKPSEFTLAPSNDTRNILGDNIVNDVPNPNRKALQSLMNGDAVPTASIQNVDDDNDTKNHENLNRRPVSLGDCMLGVSIKSKVDLLLGQLKPGELFCDPDFVADSDALFQSDNSYTNTDVIWKRPVDLVPEGKYPHMLVDGVSRDDIKQGILGDCWFLSSCAAVSQQEKFMKSIIPSDQPLFGQSYKGIVHFRFWRFGDWVDVYIDDLLPTRNGELIYARCEDPTEFWVALIEKAYAKLHGCYEAIEGGQTMDALVDLTGGLAERYEVKGADPNMYRYLLRAHRAGSFIACSRKGDWRMATEADANGLVSGHAYTITKVMRIVHRMGEEKLLRIRNPWGNETEWKGSWCDSDSNWKWVDDETKTLMGLELRDDGEFWMSFKDFCRHFQEVTICTTGPEFHKEIPGDETGHVMCMKGAWESGLSAGGSRNHLEKFATNPQYVLTLTEADDFDPVNDDPENEGKCSVVIALMQEHRRSHRRMGIKTLQIGFILYATDDPNHRLPTKHFRFNYETGKSGIYINLREVSGRFELDPGHYIIIPSTFVPGEESSFMLRVYAQKKFTLSGPLS